MCCKSWQCRDYDDGDDFDDDDGGGGFDDDDVNEEEERMGLPSWRKSWQSPDDKTRILLWFPTKSCHFLVSSSELPFLGSSSELPFFWFPARSCHFLAIMGRKLNTSCNFYPN